MDLAPCEIEVLRDISIEETVVADHLEGDALAVSRKRDAFVLLALDQLALFEL